MSVDYSKYSFSQKEKLILFLQIMGISTVCNVLFYQSWYGYVFLIPLSSVWIPVRRKQKCKDRKRQLHYQFKDALISLCVALRAGYSLENAVREAAGDMLLVYGEQADMTREFQFMANGLKVNRSLDQMVADFAERSQIEDIENFASVLTTARKMGGDTAGILMKSAVILEDKIDVKKEIDSMIAGKKMEQRIMSMMPVMIIVYMRWSSPGFLDCLYGNVLGVSVMTLCLFIYLISLYLAERIMDIEV